MSEYTREEILKMIEEVGGPENLDLSGKDLSGIDLSREAIIQELENYRKNNPDQTPLWFSDVTKSIDLHGATLKEANLSEAHLEGAVLGEAHLERAILRGAHLERADLWEAHLERAILRGSHLEGADLWEAHLERADLWGAHLERADLRGAHLEGTYLRRAHLEKVDFSVAESLAGAYLHGAWLDQARMTKEQLGGHIGEEIDKRYYLAKEAYLLLKNNFNQIGRYDDASWAYCKERQMEKMTYHPKLARTYYAKSEGLPEKASPKSWAWWRFYVKYTLKWAWDWIIEGLYGYGEKPHRTLGVAVLVLLVFTGLFLITGGLSKGPDQTVTLRDYFLFSLASFATIDLPPLQATCPWAQFLATLEAITGISLLALLMFTLGRRISRS